MSQISLFNETGQFIMSRLGAHSALVCKGDEDFLQRCCALAKNYGISTKTRWAQIGSLTGSEQLRYIVVEKERIKLGLTKYFQWEVIQNCKSQIDYSCTTNENEEIIIDWDENKVLVLAQEMTERFWREKVTSNNDILRKYKVTGYTEFTISNNHKNKTVNIA